MPGERLREDAEAVSGQARQPKARRPVGREDSLGRTLAGGFRCPLERVGDHFPLYSPSLF